jgi:hypothetical protein
MASGNTSRPEPRRAQSGTPLTITVVRLGLASPTATLNARAASRLHPSQLSARVSSRVPRCDEEPG